MFIQTRLLGARPAADKGSWDGLESLSHEILVKFFIFQSIIVGILLVNVLPVSTVCSLSC